MRIDPLVSVQSQLDRDEPIEVFEVDTQEPVYWRMVALPEFDGTSWKPEEDPVAIDVGPDTPLVTNARPNPALVGDPQTVDVVSARRATWRCRGSRCPTSRSRPTCSPTTSGGTRRVARCC